MYWHQAAYCLAGKWHKLQLHNLDLLQDDATVAPIDDCLLPSM
jgi:hypothetical protein